MDPSTTSAFQICMFVFFIMGMFIFTAKDDIKSIKRDIKDLKQDIKDLEQENRDLRNRMFDLELKFKYGIKKE